MTYANIEPSPPCQIPQQSGSHEYRPIDHYTQPTGECPAGTSAAGGACPSPARQAMDEYARYFEINQNADLDHHAASDGDDDVHVDPILECNREFYLDENTEASNERFPTPPGFFTNIDGNDDSICSRDIIVRGPMWNSSKVELRQGMLFSDKHALKYAVKLYHVRSNREYVVVDSRKNAWVLKCKHDCPWRMRATQKKKSIFFEITQYPVLSHNCIYERGNRDHCNLNARFIAQVLKNQIAVSF